jgi:hypothetical protein
LPEQIFYGISFNSKGSAVSASSKRWYVKMKVISLQNQELNVALQNSALVRFVRVSSLLASFRLRMLASVSLRIMALSLPLLGHNLFGPFSGLNGPSPALLEDRPIVHPLSCGLASHFLSVSPVGLFLSRVWLARLAVRRR